VNDLWTPDVKATQLMDVISGVAPIRSVVNVGSGVADLVLLPIAQYKKDGRIVRGMQKGATAFMRSTGMEALRLGAQLATGTQVILEQTENVLGAQFKDAITAEALQHLPEINIDTSDLSTEEQTAEEGELFSRYAEQPMDMREGIQSAYRSLKKNLNSAAQTILAVPMEVYERSGNEVSSMLLDSSIELTFTEGTCSSCGPSGPDCCVKTNDRCNRGYQQNTAGHTQHL
jgi:autophagy-related protein 2